MTVSYRTAITIVQFIFFVPSAIYAIWLSFHCGLKAAGTWRFIATLSLLRVAGGISYFVSLSNPGLNVIVSVVAWHPSVLMEIIAITIMYTTVYFAPLPKDAAAERIAGAESGDTNELAERRTSSSLTAIELGSESQTALKEESRRSNEP
ncbi:hypothetical protein N7455_007594 [Penicillium solitum]|uniref:uncharacterized protein n=1 Tax=Penicillium solitum TaxID=60172 RepID=UPI0032C4165A|nr:hypothetical protein N7536_012425 [Penicillium majusculum]KAJ5856700.1 hypothetical protein N7455_007594 [Penicillium solitum]